MASHVMSVNLIGLLASWCCIATHAQAGPQIYDPAIFGGFLQTNNIDDGLPDDILQTQITTSRRQPAPVQITEEMNWPAKDALAGLGDIVGLAANQRNASISLFHRADRHWDEQSFDSSNQFLHADEGPIRSDTILELDSASGKVLRSWGKGFFYLPHSIHVDSEGNTWVSDVALHQVMKFPAPDPEDGGAAARVEPELVLGKALEAGSDEEHFCKPTSIVTSTSGIVYIADGYCNSRILVYSSRGRLLDIIGLGDGLRVPHSLTLLEEQDLLCAADRENDRIVCYTAGLADQSPGRMVYSITAPELGRVYAIGHLEQGSGTTLLALNGGGTSADLEGLPMGVSLDLRTEQVSGHWTPLEGYSEPHDMTVLEETSSIPSRDLMEGGSDSPAQQSAVSRTSIFVSDIGKTAKRKLYKFVIN